MKNEARTPDEAMPTTLRAWQGDTADEISSVRPSLQLVTDVDFEVAVSDRAPWDPAPVYATPRLLVQGQRIAYLRRYFIGTHFATGILPSETWREEMAADGVAPKLIDRCARYLSRRSL
jgi:hypothetical protein